MNTALTLSLQSMTTPIGEMLVVADHEGNLRAIDWRDHEDRMHRLLRLHYERTGFAIQFQPVSSKLTAALLNYFEGNLAAIDSLPVKTGGTAFQQEVWKALRNIPCGETLTYKTLAEKIDRAKAVRAVGLANGSNPVGIVVPCHRVIGANGSLTGYGGGLERKKWLLRHESQSRSLF